MGSMLEAMRKAGLVSDKQAKDQEKAGVNRTKKSMKKDWHKAWKERAYHNRHGDIALFEIWRKTEHPNEYLERCALCGKRDMDPVPWLSQYGKAYVVCEPCFAAERELE